MYRAIWINLDVVGTILLLNVVLNNVFLKFVAVVSIQLKRNCFIKKVFQVVHSMYSSSRNSEMLVIDHVFN